MVKLLRAVSNRSSEETKGQNVVIARGIHFFQYELGCNIGHTTGKSVLPWNKLFVGACSCANPFMVAYRHEMDSELRA